MSIEGDTADKLVQEGIQVTEAAVKLAGLGAKNLAALLMALLKDNEKLKGKTNMNTLLRQDRQLAVFHLQKEELTRFKQLAQKYGVLFAVTYHKNQEKGLCDVLVKEDDVARVNRILEMMEYPAPGKGENEKNESARAPQNGRSKERGPGWMHRPQDRVIDPVAKYGKKTGMLENLSPEILSAIVLKVAGENREYEKSSSLSHLIASKDIAVLPILDVDTQALQKAAAKLDIPITFLPTEAHGKHHMLVQKKDEPLVNRLFEQYGYAMPNWESDLMKKEIPAKERSETISVKDRIEQVKEKEGAPARVKQKPTRNIRSQAR